MPKDDLVYVGHMLDTAQKALDLARGKTRRDYDVEEALRIALAHLDQVIGEGARHVSAEFCAAHPKIPWEAIVGMRHRVVHDYLNVDEDMVWQTVRDDLPELVKALGQIVPLDSDK